MKNYKIIVILILVILNNKLWSQKRFIPGLKAGVSTSQVAGDNYSGYNKAGFIGGGTLTAQFSEKYAGHFEITYIQKGSQHNGNQEKGDYNFYFLELDYIEVPLLFQFHQRKFTYEVGPAIAFLIGEEEFFNFFNLTGANPFNKNEISINAGLNYSIYKGLGINWRFSHSITPIRAHASGATRWYNPGQMNNVLTFTLTYKFNQNNAE